MSVLNWFLRKEPEIRNSENSCVWVLPNIRRLRQVRDTKFGTNASNKILLNAAKCQGYNSFYCFWVINGKLPPSPQIRVNKIYLQYFPFIRTFRCSWKNKLFQTMNIMFIDVFFYILSNFLPFIVFLSSDFVLSYSQVCISQIFHTVSRFSTIKKIIMVNMSKE